MENLGIHYADVRKGSLRGSSLWRNDVHQMVVSPFPPRNYGLGVNGADNLIRFANRTQQWARDRPALLDLGFAATLFVLELVDLLARSDAPTSPRQTDLLSILLIAAASAVLIKRRHNPVGSLLLVSVLMVIFYVRDYGSFMSIVGLAGFYAVAAHARNRRHAWITMTGTAVVLIGVAAFTLLDLPDGFQYSGAASMTTSICLAAFVGVVMRNRQQIFMQAEARADQALADQAAAAERAATQERLRIAREMHDVVAHGMSVISVQAAAAQEIARTEPDRAVELMKIVETTGRESLNEMRRMLGVLRNGATPDSENNITRAPQPSLDDLETIIDHCRGAGLETELTIAGEKRPLPAGLELTVYRIVQEALTNVLKHGGNAATANVEIAYGDTTIRIEVSDTGRGLLAGLDGHRPGNGVIGMRERVELYDGEFSAGPQPGGGYLVTALLTTDSTTKRPQVSSAEPLSAETATTGTST